MPSWGHLVSVGAKDAGRRIELVGDEFLIGRKQPSAHRAPCLCLARWRHSTSIRMQGLCTLARDCADTQAQGIG